MTYLVSAPAGWPRKRHTEDGHVGVLAEILSVLIFSNSVGAQYRARFPRAQILNRDRFDISSAAWAHPSPCHDLLHGLDSVRIMRTCLHASDTALSPERALAKLRRIQHHRVTLNGNESVAGISSINKEQTNILTAQTIKKPTLDTQLTLL